MANPPKNPTVAPKATEAPKPGDQATTVAAPEAPKEKKGPKPVAEHFPSADEALKVANSREKGARRAFKTTFQGKDVFSVSANAERAAWSHFVQEGGTVTEIGKPARVAKVAGPDAIMAALASLSEADRATVMASLEKMKK